MNEERPTLRFTVSEKQKEHLRNMIEGKQCDVPVCPYEAVVTKKNSADEPIQLCTIHRALTPEQVMHIHQQWLESLG